RAPESYSPPVQFSMPPGPEPAVPAPDPNRPLIAMADVDWKSHVLGGVLESPDGDEWRWCRPSARFRLTPDNVRGLPFYMRVILVDDSFRQSGAVTVAISINGHELARPRFANGGQHEYTHPVPEDWLAAGTPAAITLDVSPPLVTSGGDQLGVL